MGRIFKFLFLYIAPIVITLGILISVWGFSQYPKPGMLANDKIILIAQGSSTKSIATQLMQEQAIDKAGRYVFLAASKLTKAKLKAGEYEIKAASSIKDLIALLSSGKTYQHKITIPEGLMSVEIVAALNAASALSTATIDTIPAEGALLPETYRYSRGDTKAALLDRMEKSMQETLASLWAQRSEGLPLQSPEEAVILASVVEKETGVASERARVAGVFINRMNIGMPLQSDPTVIYALTLGKQKLDRPLYRSDLDINSPYNTYVARGLPPTPIANPGRASIEAVLHPEKNEYLYFVADGTGGHAFAKTLEEHLRNVAHWRSVQKRTP